MARLKITLMKHKMNLQRCDDGSDGRRGFVSTPANDTDWPVCKYGKYIQPEFIFPPKPHKIEPFSSSYSLSCAASFPSWRSTTGQKPTFSRIWIFRLKVSYTVVPEEPKKSCSLDNEENTLKCFSFQVGRLTIGWWNEAPSSMILLSFCWALTYFRRASLWRLRVTGRRS